MRDRITTSFFILLLMLLSFGSTWAQVSVTPSGSGNGTISITTTSAAGGTNTFTTITGATIAETNPGDMTTGIYTVTLPANWVFDTAAPPIQISSLVGDIAIASTNLTPTATSFSFAVNAVSSFSASSFRITGMRIKPTTSLIASETGNMTITKTAGVALVPFPATFEPLACIGGAANAFTITGASPATAGSNVVLTITAVDVFGNTVAAYAGAHNLIFSGLSAAPNASVATVTDNTAAAIAVGTGTTLTFTAGVATAGGTLVPHKVEVATVACSEGAITTAATGGATFALTVTPGILGTFTFDAIVDQVHNTSFSITMHAKDLYGNAKTNYVGTPTLSINAPSTSISPSPTGAFAGGDRTETVTILGVNAAAQITATDVVTGTSAAFAITKAVCTVTPDAAQTKVYGSANPAYTYTYAPNPLVGADLAIAGVLGRAAGEGVGTYAYTTGTLSNTNYSFVIGGANTFSITRYPITIIPVAAQSKIYGNLDPTFTFTPSVGSYQNGDVTLTGALTRAVGENVGNYLISQGTVTTANNANYTVSFDAAPVNFAITTLNITVNPTAGQSKVFSNNAGTDPVFAFTTVPTGALPNGGTVSLAGALTRAAGETVAASPYAITQGGVTNAANTNYNITFTAGVTFAITPLPVSIQGNPGQSKAFGAADPVFTYTPTPDPAATGGAIGGLLSRVGGESVGTYNYTLGSLSAGTNYSLSMNGAPGTFAINALVITVTPVSGQSKVYGDVDPGTYTYTFSPALIGADAFTGKLGRNAGEAAGVNAYQYTQNTLALPSNYTLTLAAGFFTITPKAITVTPTAAQTKVYNGTGADPVFAYTTVPTGTLANGTPIALGGALDRVAGKNVGNYNITQGTVTNGTNPNYTITFTAGVTFGITTRPITITAATDSKVYDGNMSSVGVPTYPALEAGDVIGTAPTQTYDNKNVGTTHVMTASGFVANDGFGGADYAVSYATVATGVITQKPITITAVTDTKTYDGTTSSVGVPTVVGVLAPDTYSAPTQLFSNKHIGAANKTLIPNAVTVYEAGGPGVSGNYNPTYVNFTTGTINVKTIQVTAVTDTKTYNGTTSSVGVPTVAGADIQVGDAVGTAPTQVYSSRNAGVGNRTLIPSGLVMNDGNGGANYSPVYNNFLTGTIDVRPITVQANTDTKVFNNTVTSGVAPTVPALQTGDNITTAPTQVYDNVNVGNTHVMTASGLVINDANAGNNYSISYATIGTGVITPLGITVTADAKTKVYNIPTNPDPALTYVAAPDPTATGGSFAGSLTRVAGETVGTYQIQQGSLALSANYTLTYVPANLTITNGTVTVTAIAGFTKVYGAADPLFTYTSSVPGLVYSGALSRAAGEGVGHYAITQGSLSIANWTIAFISNDFEITPKAITVTPTAAQAKVYNGQAGVDPVLAYTVAPGYAFTETTLNGALDRAVGNNVGNYAIGIGNLVATNPNYTITLTPGVTFGITPKAVEVMPNAGQSKAFGTANPAYAYTPTPALYGADVFTGALGRAAGENVGTYAYTLNTLAATNYTVTLATVGVPTFAITGAPLTVTATAGQTKVYGAADPVFAYTTTPAGVVMTGALGRATGTAVGNYAINIGTLANTNYTVTFVSSTFAITPKAVTVTAAAGQGKTFGATDPALTYTTAPALVTGDTFTGSLVRASGEAVGNYAITQGTLANGNYTITYVPDFFAIGKKTITVTATAGTKVYGAADPVFAYTSTPALVGTDTFAGVLARAAGVGVGTYAINQGTLALSANYNLVFVPANFVITPLAVTVTPTAGLNKQLGAADPVLTYTVAPALVTGDAFTGALARAAGETLGTYAINQGTLALSANYSLTFVPGTFQIAGKQITVTAVSGHTKVYGDADPVFTYTVVPALDPGISLNGALGRAAGTAVGTYAINVGTLAHPNYAITFIPANFTITAKPVTVTPTAGQKKLTGDADPTFTYTPTPALVGSDVFSGALGRAAGETVGTYAYTLNTLSAGTNYTLTLAAGQTFAILQRIAAPVASAGTSVTPTSFMANWAAVTGATGYRLDVSTSASFSTFVTGFQDKNVGTALTASVTGLTASTTYYYRVRAVDANGPSLGSNIITVTSGVVGIDDYANGLPKTFKLFQNYPNPFNPTTLIRYAMPSEGRVRITVSNVLGEQIATLVDDTKGAGYYEVQFNANNLPSGNYFYTISTPQQTITKKMVLLK